MSLDILKESERGKLRSVCRGLLEPVAAEPLVLQLERVLCYLTDAEQQSATTNPDDISSVFRARGLVPSRLLQASHRITLTAQPKSTLNPETLALCFAACAFPQRAFQMGETELELRVAAFQRFLLMSGCSTATPAFSDDWSTAAQPLFTGSTAATLSLEERLSLLADLSASERGLEIEARRETNERLNGVVLYLATCGPELVERTIAPWRSDASLVQYFRKFLPAPPSCLVHQDQSASRSPDWGTVRSRLLQLFPDEPEECHSSAVILEQMVWKEARRWLPASLVRQRVEDFWESMWDKLISGFPYYAFRSRFTWWWRQCLQTFRFSDYRLRSQREFDDTITAGTLVEQDSSPGHLAATPEILRIFREGYRLVRTTFFRRPDKQQASRGQWESQAQTNEQLRRALDSIWYERLQQQLSEELRPSLVKDIAARFPELGAHTINNLSHRLRMRIWAYALARLSRLSNSQILTARRPQYKAPSDIGKYPLAGQPAVLTIASLVRMIPSDQSLLASFTSHIFLRPLVEPQRPDKWVFKGYLAELWHWLRDQTFREALDTGAERGALADQALARALQESPFVELLEKLTSSATESEWLRFIEAELTAERTAALTLLARVLGEGGRDAFEESAIRLWRRKAKMHWLVPVWYLTFIEQLDESELLARLRVDSSEVEAVSELARAMRTARPGVPSVRQKLNAVVRDTNSGD